MLEVDWSWSALLVSFRPMRPSVSVFADSVSQVECLLSDVMSGAARTLVSDVGVSNGGECRG